MQLKWQDGLKIKQQVNGPRRKNEMYKPTKKLRGSNNFRWKGGVSEYPNQYLMKLRRKEKIYITKGKCEKCNKKRKRLTLHHIDFSRDNHSFDNLLLLCTTCHGCLHRIHNRLFHLNKTGIPKKHKRKYKYGISLILLSKRTNFCIETLSTYFHNPRKLKLKTQYRIKTAIKSIGMRGRTRKYHIDGIVKLSNQMRVTQQDIIAYFKKWDLVNIEKRKKIELFLDNHRNYLSSES